MAQQGEKYILKGLIFGNKWFDYVCETMFTWGLVSILCAIQSHMHVNTHTHQHNVYASFYIANFSQQK